MTNNTNEMLSQASQFFEERFGVRPEVACFAPGRANLIGEHTDYNDGFVLPFALPYKTIIVASRSTSEFTTVVSTSMPDEGVTFKIDKTLSKGEPSWANYVKGTIFQYLGDLPDGAAFNAVITSDVPLGSGLSSSAALEVATATLVEELYNLPRNTEETSVKKAKRCQKAEHDFTGTPCGIMDQYISALGKEGNLLLIDCRSNKATLVPSGAGPAAPLILVTNSNVKHSLSGSEYPDRVRQCKEAVAVLKKKYPDVRALRDASMEMLDDVKNELSEVVYRRAKHVIGENKRTTDTVDALRRNDYKRVGELMNESHNSLRDDYEVSCVELDCLVRIALEVPGVYGSRMTGGGFGGCTVTLVERSAVKELEKLLHDKYQQEYATDCTCYEAVPSAGAGIMSLKQDEDGCESSATFNWIDYAVPGLVAALSVGVAVSFFLRRK